MRLSSAAGRGTLAATVLASGMALLDSTVVNVALPRLGEDLHAGLDGLQWTVNGYTLTLAAFVLLGGALGDRYGRRLVFVIGLGWFTAASALCGLAGSVGLLIAARVLQGIGAALLTPGSLAIIQSTFDERDRAKAIGAWSGLGGVAAAIGPFVGGWLVDALSWRWVFYLNIPLALVAGFLTWKFVPESKGVHLRGFDFSGAVLGAVALGGITYALIAGSWTGTAVGLAAGVAFVLVELRSPHPMVPPALFRSRAFSAINVVTFFVYAALSGSLFFLVLYLQLSAGFSALGAGVSLLPFTILMLLFSARAGALGQRIGARIPLIVGPLICAAGLLLLIRADQPYFTRVFPGVVVLALGMTLVVAPLTSSVLAAAPDNYVGVASGVNNAVARAAGLLAVAALPLLVGLSGAAYTDPSAFAAGFRTAMWITAGLMVAGSATAWLIPPRIRTSTSGSVPPRSPLPAATP